MDIYIKIGNLTRRNVCYDVNNPTIKYVIIGSSGKKIKALDTFGKEKHLDNNTIIIIRKRGNKNGSRS